MTQGRIGFSRCGLFFCPLPTDVTSCYVGGACVVFAYLFPREPHDCPNTHSSYTRRKTSSALRTRQAEVHRSSPDTRAVAPATGAVVVRRHGVCRTGRRRTEHDVLPRVRGPKRARQRTQGRAAGVAPARRLYVRPSAELPCPEQAALCELRVQRND